MYTGHLSKDLLELQSVRSVFLEKEKNIEGIKLDSQRIRAISSPNCFPTNQFLFASWYVVYFFGYCKLLRS